MAATEPHLRDNPTSVSQGSTVCTISCRHQESLRSKRWIRKLAGAPQPNVHDGTGQTVHRAAVHPTGSPSRVMGTRLCVRGELKPCALLCPYGIFAHIGQLCAVARHAVWRCYWEAGKHGAALVEVALAL